MCNISCLGICEDYLKRVNQNEIMDQSSLDHDQVGMWYYTSPGFTSSGFITIHHSLINNVVSSTEPIAEAKRNRDQEDNAVL